MVKKINSKVLIAFLLVLLGVLSALTVFGGGSGSGGQGSESSGSRVDNYVAKASYGFRAYFAVVSPEVEFEAGHALASTGYAKILTINGNETISMLNGSNGDASVGGQLKKYRDLWSVSTLDGTWDSNALFTVSSLEVVNRNNEEGASDFYVLNNKKSEGISNWVEGIKLFLADAVSTSNAKFGITDVDAVDKAFNATCEWAVSRGAPSWVNVETEGLVLVCEPIVKLMRGDVSETLSFQDYLMQGSSSSNFYISAGAGEGDSFVTPLKNYGITDLDTTSDDYPLTNPYINNTEGGIKDGYCIHFGHNILARYYGAGTTTIIYKGKPGVNKKFGELNENISVRSELNGSTFKNNETPAEIIINATGSIFDSAKTVDDWKDVRKSDNEKSKVQYNDQLGSNDVTSWDKYSLESMGTFKVGSKETVKWGTVDNALDLNPNDIKLTWGEEKSVNGTFNAGSAYYLNSINDKIDVSGLAEKVTDDMSGNVITSDCTKVNSEFLLNKDDIPNYGFALDNLIATWEANSDHKNTKKVRKKDKTTGISINLMCVQDEVSSYKTTITYDATKQKVTKKTTKKSTYTTDSFKNLKSGKNACYVAVVPNTVSRTKYTKKNLESLIKTLESADNTDILEKFKGWFMPYDYEVVDRCHGGDTVSVGAKVDETKNGGKGKSYGYSVYFLEVVGDLSISGEVNLQDYELNFVYNDLVGHVSKLKDYCIIYKDLWTLNDTVGSLSTSVVSCDNKETPHEFTTYDIKEKEYGIDLLDISTSKDDGKTVSNDNGLIDKENWGTTLLLYNQDLGLLANRETLRNGFEIDTSSINEREAKESDNDIDLYTVSYAYNLTRSSFGDMRTLSSINKNNLDTDLRDYAKNVLGMAIENKPELVLKTVESSRNSNAKITGSFKEVIKWDAVYTLTGDKTKTTTKTFVHTCEDENGHKNVLQYNELVSTKDSLKAFNVNGLPSRTFTVNLTEIGFKYLTQTKDIGKNSIVTADKRIDERKTATSTTGVLENDSYRFAYVKLHNDNEGDNNIKLKYYPEVKMRSYRYVGDTIVSGDSVMAEDLYTMGEELRTSNSSSMYIYKINKATGKNDITGKVYSDGFAVGTGASALDTSKPVIYAGSDVTLNADCNFTINMYGYSLDLVNKDDKLVGLPYESIVADKSNIYGDWGNDTNLNKAKLLKQYEDWATEMTKLENYSADVTLDVKGGGVNKTYNNFSTTLGKITKPVSSETGAYNLEIRNGVLDKTVADYEALIKQIMADYGYTDEQKADAEALFEKSGLYTAIINAIEHSNGDDNKSQEGAETLGSDKHWYDEEVRTIVIRRFETDPVTVSGVVLQDKIDYGAAPSSTGLGSQNSNGSFTNSATGKWYLTLYFKNLPVSLSDSTIYKPDDMTVKESAIDTLAVITNNVHIDGADFLIPNATTSDMNN